MKSHHNHYLADCGSPVQWQWPFLYIRYYGVIFVKWKDVGMCHPSFHTSIEKHTTYQLQRDGGFNILCHTLICLGSYPLRGQYKLLTTPILINLWAMLRGRKGAERDGGDKENREVTTEKNGSCTRVSLVICHSLTLNQDFGAFNTLK